MKYTKQFASQIILFFVSPALSLYMAFKSTNERFIAFTGTLFMGIVGSVFIYNARTDGNSHLQTVYRDYMDMNFSNFIHFAYELLLFRPTEIGNDLYKHILSYLAGGVFGVPEFLHLFAGLVLGFFFTKSVLLILEDKQKQRISALIIALVFMFLIVRSISALNSIRMWTGMWVFFYGSYAFVKRGNKKYLIIVLSSIFIHFAYIIYTVPLALALYFKKRRIIISFLYIFSLIFSVDYQTFTEYAPIENELYQKKSSYILSESRLEEKAGIVREGPKDNFYVEYGSLIYNKFSIPLLSIILIYLYNFKKNEKSLDFLIAGGLLLLVLSNISGGFSPSIAGRGNTIAATFLTGAIINFMYKLHLYSFTQGTRRILNSGIWLFFFSSIPYLLFHIAYIMKITSIFIFFIPVASWLLGDSDMSIRDAIMSLF